MSEQQKEPLFTFSSLNNFIRSDIEENTSIMSEDVDRNQVFKTTRVRTALKNDGSWIHSSKQEKEARDKAGTDRGVETRPALIKQKSYVLSTAKIFGSVDSPPSATLQNTQLSPSEGDSANQANAEVTPPQKDAQPEGSTVETTNDTKAQAPTEEVVQNGEAQTEQIAANTAAENKKEYADTPVDQPNVEHTERAAEVSADVHVEECIHNGEAQTVSSAIETPEAVSPVEPVAQPIANTTAENKGEHADTTAVQANIEHGDAKVSADACVEDPIAETSHVAGTEENKDPAEAPVLAAKLKPQKEPSIETEPANATQVEDAGVESGVEPAEESCNECPPEHAAKEIFKAVAAIVVESPPDTSVVIDATPGEEPALQNSVEPVPDLLEESVSESPAQCATETATEVSCERCPPEQSTEEIVEAVADVVVESSPETPAVNNATTADEAAIQGTVEPILDTVSEPPALFADETADSVVEAVVESKVESAAPAEPVLKTRAEEVAECEVQPVANTAVEQSAAPENAAEPVKELSIEDALESVTASEAAEDKLSDRAIELTDALDVEPPSAEPVPKPVEDPKQSHSEESKLNQSEDANSTEIFQKPMEEIRSTYTLKETSDGRAICSFCDQVIDGTVKITLSEPLIACHPDCLKCGVCAKVLGDLLTPLFLHGQVIHCGGCFAKTLKT